MKKIVKRWGHSNVIIISPEETKIYNLKAGDFVDVEIKRYRGEKKDE